jgi:hypothetical protein
LPPHCIYKYIRMGQLTYCNAEYILANALFTVHLIHKYIRMGLPANCSSEYYISHCMLCRGTYVTIFLLALILIISLPHTVALNIQWPTHIMRLMAIPQLPLAYIYKALILTTWGVCYMQVTNTEWCEKARPNLDKTALAAYPKQDT